MKSNQKELISEKVFPKDRRLTNSDISLLKDVYTDGAKEYIITLFQCKNISLVDYHNALEALEMDVHRKNELNHRYVKTIEFLTRIEESNDTYDRELVDHLECLNNLLEAINSNLEKVLDCNSELVSIIGNQNKLIHEFLNTNYKELPTPQEIVLKSCLNGFTVDQLVEIMTISVNSQSNQDKIN